MKSNNGRIRGKETFGMSSVSGISGMDSWYKLYLQELQESAPPDSATGLSDDGTDTGSDFSTILSSLQTETDQLINSATSSSVDSSSDSSDLTSAAGAGSAQDPLQNDYNALAQMMSIANPYND
jgi:hypothetical protein